MQLIWFERMSITVLLCVLINMLGFIPLGYLICIAIVVFAISIPIWNAFDKRRNRELSGRRKRII
jgi:hypothetical protein